MAVITEPKDSRLQLSFITGKDARGMDIIRMRTYNGIKSSATDQDAMDIASILSNLQINAVKAVLRVNTVELTQG